MNPNTGTFIGMDSYSGSINDPVSLHKYLYANANPVMYSDPSGYSSLLTEIVVEVVVQNVLTGIISGSVSMGLSILNDMACATPDKPFEFGSNQVSAFVEGFLLGALLGNVCVLAKSLQMIFIIRALAVISALNGMMCAVEGYKANQSGHYELGLAYGTLAILSFAGAGKGWQEANNLSNAVNTASGATNNSPNNTQTATIIKKYGPCNPGPLKPSVANSFNGGTYTEEVLNVDTTYYRVYGGQSGKVGSYMTSVSQNGGMQSQMDLALNPEWGNTAKYVTKVTVPAGTTIYQGTAAPQTINGGTGYLLGGGNQVYIPEVENEWFMD
jgi:hypothetical protein